MTWSLLAIKFNYEILCNIRKAKFLYKIYSKQIVSGILLPHANQRNFLKNPARQGILIT